MTRIDKIRKLCEPHWPKNINNPEMIEYHRNCRWLLSENDRLSAEVKKLAEFKEAHSQLVREKTPALLRQISDLTTENEKAWKQLHIEIENEQGLQARVEQLEAELARYRDA